ncbi:hypothetical protein FACS1894198_0040 [Clostridia bacterium]|nr:hypothetical protein FACS1894198_0040 [Clostridia bacterium]
MTTVNATKFRSNIFQYLESVTEGCDIINVTTKKGNAVVLSESDYNALMETLYINSVPGLKEKIIEGLETPVSECIPYDKADWSDPNVHDCFYCQSQLKT